MRLQAGKSWGQRGWGGPLGWEGSRGVWGEGAGAAQDRSWASLGVLPRGVSQAVPPQITVSPEHFAALLAAVGLDVCMGEKVSFQITSLIKGSSTCGTFVWRFLFRCEARQRINPSHDHGTLVNSSVSSVSSLKITSARQQKRGPAGTDLCS